MTIFIVLLVLALVGGCIYMAYRDEKSFNAAMDHEYSDCLGKGESEYTCKSYIASKRAARSADIAAASAMAAAASSQASASMNATRQ